MKLLVLDGNSIINRAFYGIRALNAPDGTPTNGVFGFLSILQSLYERERPDGVCVAFDVHAPTHRHRLYDAYKAGRRPMPEELKTQMPLMKEVLDTMGIRRYELEGWEADDLLGLFGQRAAQSGWDCRLVSGDRDVLQLVTERTHVIHIKTRMGRTETIEYDPARFREEYGFEPEKLVDLKALMGDSSDNIPGVPGIGEKGAMELLHRFGSLEGVYAALEDEGLTPGQKKKLAAGEQSARLSYTLATIRPDAPLAFRPEDTLWQLQTQGALYGLFRRLGFTKFIDRWGLTPGAATTEDAADPAVETEAPFPQEELTPSQAIERVLAAEAVALQPVSRDSLDALQLCDGRSIFTARWADDGEGYDRLLRTVFDGKVKKIGHDVKDLMRLLLADGLGTEGFVFDTALAGYLLKATASVYTPEGLCASYRPGAPEEPVVGRLWRLVEPMKAALEREGLWPLYAGTELPLCAVLAEMEQSGFCVDRKALYELGEELGAQLEQLQERIWDYAGHEFNIQSPKQLGTVLFDELCLPAGKKTKTGWSTNADVLEGIRLFHPIVQAVLDYRELSKLKGTYTDGLSRCIGADGRIHTEFKMTVTATGRLSSAEPNLQNIPVRKPSGAALRRMFIAGPGCVLADADYSQIELRLLAALSGDEAMQEAFRSGADIHTVTASQVFRVPPEQVTPLLRSRAKAVNFGIVYGIGAFSLAQDIGVSNREAKEYIDAYMDRYPGVRDYLERCVEQARQSGYAVTPDGRRRAMPELAASNRNVRAFGERVARNMPIQGAAADVMKRAMVRVHARLKEELPSARLLLQVHDELIVECPEADGETAARILTEEMQGAADYAVPLSVSAGIGRSWADAH